ncbi:phosphoglycerate mutase [Citricoccus sp. SGAir0253]|uniref:histidine phosphatase family protein n=1 Tax=Citricoccus sp. SGAir0253 TaxID=2567881 RepID=UPI0010CCED38|nr:histidine phosphatase family protein [Citricoccus sp. SGAir0253]QCU77662.1 phosphoglycerate mutase [Citricoccus sp. SGAir0253]
MSATSEDSPAGPRPTLVLLVRHGQTPTTGQVLPGRAPGLHLSEHGRAQAERVAGRLAELPVTAVYASPLERTVQTAGPTAERTGVPVVTEEGLLEGDFGAWTGANLAELARLPEWRTVQHEPESFRFPDGESFVEIRDRMAATLRRLREAHPGGTIVCFSHADPIRVAVSDALGTPLNRFQRLSVGPCSVSVIAYPPAADGAGGAGGADGAEEPDPVVLTVNSTQDSLAELRPA